ncbi:MAG: hypothetical protein KF795_26480 [Labilithrix sp.]|nr:hypothetical protein [Labilithrix sp.]
MSPRLAARLCVVFGAIAGVSACNAITGASDLGISSDDALADGGPSGRGNGNPNGGDGGGTRDGGGNGNGGDDSGLPPAAISPSLATCGLGNICMTNAEGWSPLLSLTTALGGGCPAGWPTRSEHKTSGGGGCSCECTPTSGSCGASIASRGGAACTGPSTSHAIAGDGSCSTALPGFALPVAFAWADTTNAAPKGCTGKVSSNLSPPRTTITCGGAAPTQNAACKDDEVCVPKGSILQGTNCLVHDGEVACPANLPRRTVIGTSIAEGRSCETTCACETNGCAGGTLRAFANPDCTSPLRTIDVDGTCAMSGQSLETAASYRYTASSGCKVKQAPAVLGTETVSAPRTICCVLF